MTKRRNRKDEILNASEALFYQKGYNKTTINDILEALSISKGAFYHYFKSKEEVMDAIIMRTIQDGMAKAELILQDRNLTIHQKFLMIILAQQPNEHNNKIQLLNELQQVENALMHQKCLIVTIQQLTPLLTTVVKQGVDEGVLNTPYPQESIELILCATAILFDNNFFRWNAEELEQKIKATIHMMEVCLGAKEGSFNHMVAAFDNLKSGKLP